MDAGMFVFGSDLRDEGIDVVLENLASRAQVNRVVYGALYHCARDVFPHNPVGRVVVSEPGAIGFVPDRSRYAGLLPPVAPGFSGDLLARLSERAGEHGLRMDAWLVLLHDDSQAGDRSGYVQRNVFGDQYRGSLCPANPAVQRYVVDVVADVAGRGPSSLIAESLCYHGLRHGHHHERYFNDYDPVLVPLLDLCFCDSCLEAARCTNLDAARTRALVRERAQRVLEGERTRGRSGGGGGAEDVLAAVDGLRAYLEVQRQTVTGLVKRAHDVANGMGTPMVHLDSAPPRQGPYGWEHGRWAGEVPAGLSVGVLAYGGSDEAMQDWISVAARETRSPFRVRAVLRPMPPDCPSERVLTSRVAQLLELGVQVMDFYHYGLAGLQSLDWVRQSLG